MAQVYIPEAPISRLIFGNTKMSWLWLLVRLYVGWQWLEAGYGKVFGPTSQVWVGSKAGVAVAGFLNGALQKTGGEHPDVQSWYALFLKSVVIPHAAIWSYLVAYGELLVGIALILGFLTGIAAFFGLVMNASYLFAGTVSTNPILFILGIGIVLAWRIAGFWGLDRYLLPLLGTPWQPGMIRKK